MRDERYAEAHFTLNRRQQQRDNVQSVSGRRRMSQLVSSHVSDLSRPSLLGVVGSLRWRGVRNDGNRYVYNEVSSALRFLVRRTFREMYLWLYIARFFLLFLFWSLLRSRSVVGMQRCKLANHLCHLTESSDSVVQKGISRGFMGSRRVPEAN